MKVAIIGSRDSQNFSDEIFKKYIPPQCTLIISGGARGIDSYAEQFAHKNGIPFKKIEPNYKTYGKIAPIVRNSEIVRMSDLVLAFWNFTSKGTSNVISECIRLNIPVKVINLSENSNT